MNDKEAIEMMRRSSAEIKSLRSRISALEPKAHAYDSLAAVIRMFPQPAQGYGEDIAWRLDKRISELEAEHAANSVDPDADFRQSILEAERGANNVA